MARIDPQINVRVAAEFKKKLEHAAIENGRSLNAEVVHRLEQSFTAQSAKASGEENIESKNFIKEHIKKQLHYQSFYIEKLDAKISTYRYMIHLIEKKPQENEIIGGISDLTRYRVLLEATVIEREDIYNNLVNACNSMDIDHSFIPENDDRLIAEIEKNYNNP